jgi:hypothetical protein
MDAALYLPGAARITREFIRLPNKKKASARVAGLRCSFWFR